MALALRPSVALPDNRVELEELLTQIQHRYSDLPDLDKTLQAMRKTQVSTQYLCRSVDDTLSGPSDTTLHLKQHLESTVELAYQAAQQALADNDLKPSDVHLLVMVSMTGHTTREPTLPSYGAWACLRRPNASPAPNWPVWGAYGPSRGPLRLFVAVLTTMPW
jgi:predicted naringenin-chalcone synthase